MKTSPTMIKNVAKNSNEQDIIKHEMDPDLLCHHSAALVYAYQGCKIVEGMQVCSFVFSPEPLQVRYFNPKFQHFITIFLDYLSLLQGFFYYLTYMY